MDKAQRFPVFQFILIETTRLQYKYIDILSQLDQIHDIKLKLFQTESGKRHAFHVIPLSVSYTALLADEDKNKYNF